MLGTRIARPARVSFSKIKALLDALIVVLRWLRCARIVRGATPIPESLKRLPESGMAAQGGYRKGTVCAFIHSGKRVESQTLPTQRPRQKTICPMFPGHLFDLEELASLKSRH